MLIESPEQTVRLFFSDTNCDLQRNTIENIVDGKTQKLAFHSHHCNLTLHVVKGEITNYLVKEIEDFHILSEPGSTHCFPASKYTFFSAIKNPQESETMFAYDGDACLRLIDKRLLKEGDTIFLNASDKHTVSTYPVGVSAWLVYEGTEDPNYTPICYSIMTEEWSRKKQDLYFRPTKEQVLQVLETSGLL